MHSDDDIHLTIRLSRNSYKAAEDATIAAMREGLRVQGSVNPIRVRQSHILMLAVEAGLPLVLDQLRRSQDNLSRPTGS
jgi:hypothetical protein